MMQIAFANNYLYLRGGSERVMFEEAEICAAAGVGVSFFSRTAPMNVASEHQETFPPLVDLESLSLVGKVAHLPKIVYNADTGRRFARFLDRARPSLIHAHNIYGGLTTAICDVAWRRGLPMVMTLHDYKLICPSYLMVHDGQVCEACLGGRFHHCITRRCHKGNRIASLVYGIESWYNRLLGKYDGIRYLVCPSQFIREKMRAGGIAESRLVYLPNFIDAARFEPAFDPGGYALYIGRLSKEKGITTLIEAVRGTDIPLRILGEGPLRETLEAEIAARGMTATVTFHGYQSGDALRASIRQAAFVVVPSEWYENAPMSILEAFAYGKPVIGARIGGIPEMIDHEENGLLFTPGSVEALRAALVACWSRRGDLARLGRCARDTIARRFSRERHATALLDIYRELVPARSSTDLVAMKE